jgi:hypothetical protein
MISGLSAAGIAANQSWPFYAAVAATGAHLVRQVWEKYIQQIIPNNFIFSFNYRFSL